MKRLLIILLLFPAIIQAQTTYPIRGISRVVYGGDTLDTKFLTDSTKFVTNNKAFVFNKIVKVNKDTLATNAYARSVGGSGGGITSDSLNFGNDLLSWDRSNRTYKPYTSKPTGLGFYTGTTNPDGTTRLNLNGVQHSTGFKAYTSGIISNTGSSVAVTAGVSTSGDALWAYTNTGRASYLQQSGSISGTLSNPTLLIERISGGTGNITGALIEISDVPTTSGTTNYKVLTATIGATERISMNPRVADGASAVAYMFSTHNTLADNAARILSLKNNTTEVFYVNNNGTTHTRSTYAENSAAPGFYSYIDITNNAIVCNGTTRLNLNPNASDGASSIAHLFDTHNNLTTTGAKLASFKNQGTEKLSIDKDGNIEITTASQGIILKSPDGTRYKITVANGGTLTVTAL